MRLRGPDAPDFEQLRLYGFDRWNDFEWIRNTPSSDTQLGQVYGNLPPNAGRFAWIRFDETHPPHHSFEFEEGSTCHSLVNGIREDVVGLRRTTRFAPTCQSGSG